MKPPRLATAMTPFPYSVDAADPLGAAEALMEAHGIRHTPVTAGGEVIGMLSDRDIKAVHGYVDESCPARDLALGPAYAVDIETPLPEVLSRMAEEHLGSAAVTRQGKLVGILTATDVCRTFAEHLREQFPDPPPDGAA